jgi:hypothetical protein
MRYVTAGAAVLAVVVILLVAGCGGSKPQHPAANPAACKAAMAKAYQTALQNPSASPAAEPAACHGIPAATISKYATQILEGK